MITQTKINSVTLLLTYFVRTIPPVIEPSPNSCCKSVSYTRQGLHSVSDYVWAQNPSSLFFENPRVLGTFPAFENFVLCKYARHSLSKRNLHCERPDHVSLFTGMTCHQSLFSLPPVPLVWMLHGVDCIERMPCFH